MDAETAYSKSSEKCNSPFLKHTASLGHSWDQENDGGGGDYSEHYCEL